jgi:hypothetical protein
MEMGFGGVVGLCVSWGAGGDGSCGGGERLVGDGHRFSFGGAGLMNSAFFGLKGLLVGNRGVCALS